MNGDWKTSLAEGLADAWNNAGVVHAVANGLDEYPEGPIGRDLDVLVAPGDLRRAVRITLDYCQGKECPAVIQRLGWIYWIIIVARTPAGIRSFQVDLFDHLQWELSWILDGRHLEGRKRRGVFYTDPWSHVAKRLLINLLSTGSRSFKSKPHYLKAADDEVATIDSNISRLAGRRFPAFVDAVRAGDLQQLAGMAADLRTAIRRQGWFSVGFEARLWSAWQKQWAVNLWPRRGAPVIALNGRPDDYFESLVTQFSRRFQASFVYCALRSESKPEVGVKGDTGRPAQVPGWWSWWKRELSGDRRRSALQVVNLYRNHAVGCALFHGSGKPSRSGEWRVRTAPRPDLNLVVVTDDSGRKAGEHWQFLGVVDRVIAVTGDLAADVSLLLDAVFDWHREKAAIQQRRWESGRL